MIRAIIFFKLAIIFAATLVLTPGADAAGKKRYERSLESYTMPEVTLISQDRKKVDFKDFVLDAEIPVLLDFIYGTCTTICPVLSAGFTNLQRKLGTDVQKVRLISISIDPEHDTPEVMKDYLDKYRARPGWDFLTGSRKDIDSVMKAFDAYVQNKMAHYPITFLRAPGKEEWVRIYGLIGTRDLMTEYEKLFEE